MNNRPAASFQDNVGFNYRTEIDRGYCSCSILNWCRFLEKADGWQ